MSAVPRHSCQRPCVPLLLVSYIILLSFLLLAVTCSYDLSAMRCVQLAVEVVVFGGVELSG